jgi:2-polyprenyl-3-methyl-5-hydroxy-6-metoxy-1,4-benzoquinol methylase
MVNVQNRVSEDMIESISRIPYFSQGMYGDLDVQLTAEYFTKRYISNLKKRMDISSLKLVDCACGHGWLSIAYLLNGGGQAILCDIDGERLALAQKITDILGLSEKCQYIHKPMQDLDFAEDSVDIFCSIETLEHVRAPNIARCVNLMASSTKKAIILSTPNKLFPVVTHDTRVPFAHWMAHGIRRRYVKLWGKTDKDENDFLSPLRLKPISEKFKPVSTVLTFDSYDEWLKSYPFQRPYGPKGENRWQQAPPRYLKYYYMFTSRFLGHNNYWAAPNMSSMWVRR